MISARTTFKEDRPFLERESALFEALTGLGCFRRVTKKYEENRGAQGKLQPFMSAFNDGSVAEKHMACVEKA